MPGITIAPVSPGQQASLVELMLELHAHYTSPPTATHEAVRVHLEQHLLPDPQLCLAVAADAAHQVVGMAALVFMHSLVEPGPSGRRQCLLKELYVRADQRGAGVGARLVRWSALEAIRRGCGRMDWHVKASNARGIAFYTAMGGVPVPDRLSYSLPRVTLEHLAGPAQLWSTAP